MMSTKLVLGINRNHNKRKGMGIKTVFQSKLLEKCLDQNGKMHGKNDVIIGINLYLL